MFLDIREKSFIRYFLLNTFPTNDLKTVCAMRFVIFGLRFKKKYNLYSPISMRSKRVLFKKRSNSKRIQNRELKIPQITV